jgi:hypothetical protein
MGRDENINMFRAVLEPKGRKIRPLETLAVQTAPQANPAGAYGRDS